MFSEDCQPSLGDKYDKVKQAGLVIMKSCILVKHKEKIVATAKEVGVLPGASLASVLSTKPLKASPPNAKHQTPDKAGYRGGGTPT